MAENGKIFIAYIIFCFYTTGKEKKFVKIEKKLSVPLHFGQNDSIIIFGIVFIFDKSYGGLYE